MSYGGGHQGNHAWSLGEEESRPFIKRALEAGINFFDTANRYSLGNSEEILGRAIRDFARREEIVIGTKVYGRMRSGPNGAGLSRRRSRRSASAADRAPIASRPVSARQCCRSSEGGPKRNLGTETLSRAEPVVRIHLPPPASHRRTASTIAPVPTFISCRGVSCSGLLGKFLRQPGTGPPAPVYSTGREHK
jgi:hypothetical protein